MIMPRLDGSRILFFGVGNSGDGDGNRYINRKKVVPLQLPGEKMVLFMDKYKMVAP